MNVATAAPVSSDGMGAVFLCYNIHMEKFDIQEELKKLPASPGVYIMHDSEDNIIYVGKAIILKNRVRSYFRDPDKKTEKIRQMVAHIAWFEYVITDSELEALVLENNLIKEHRPKYNTLLKDDKTYPYIKVTTYEDFPRIFMTRKVLKDSAKYFGPYTSAGSVKDTIELLQKLYKIRTCQRMIREENPSEGSMNLKTCLYYHMGQCKAPCVGYVKREEYLNDMHGALDFLGGNYNPLIRELTEKMQALSDDMEYEKAAEVRDLISSVRSVAQKQKITDSAGEDKDIIALARNKSETIVQIFFVREGKIIGREHHYMKNAEDETDSRIIEDFITQFYAGTPFIPKEMLIPVDIDNRELIEEWLSKKRGLKLKITTPVKGKKEKLIELAEENARIVLDQDIDKVKREEARTVGALHEIEELTGIPSIQRMEAYDISNISGYNSVGSMVVFENGKPKKNDYRKFRIKTVDGPNDYASLQEVLRRRFTHGLEELKENKTEEYGKFTRFPDVIMMDGGKGQVNAAQEIIDELGLNIPICGMVKDDNHRTRGLYYQGEEIPISHASEGFKLITRLQDEAHRFAITFHKNLRSSAQTKSILDDITGVGPARRKALMKHFESIEDVRRATEEELLKIPSFNASSAKAVYDFFHKEE